MIFSAKWSRHCQPHDRGRGGPLQLPAPPLRSSHHLSPPPQLAWPARSHAEGSLGTWRHLVLTRPSRQRPASSEGGACPRKRWLRPSGSCRRCWGAEWGECQASGHATPQARLPGCMGSGLPFTAARSLETHVHTPHRTARPMTPSRGLRSRRDPKRRCPSRLRPRALLESHLVRWYEEHSTRSPQERRGPCDGHRVPSRPPPWALPAAVLMPWRERTGGPEGRGRGEAWTPGLPPTLGPDWPCVLSAPPLVASLPGPQVTTQEMGSFRLQSPGGVGGDHSRAGHS